MIQQVSWIIFDRNINDYIVGWDTLIIPQNTNIVKYQYNQALQKRTYYACGIYGAIWCISDLTGYIFSDEEILEIVALAEKEYGWQDEQGMLMSKAVDCVRNWWNKKYPDKKLISRNLYIGTESFFDALKKWHSLAVGGGIISSEYIQDAEDNGEISKTNYKMWSGHLLRASWDINIIDNYYGLKKFNTYKNNNIVALKNNGIFFPSAYLFLLDEDNQAQYEKEKVAKINAITEIVKRNKDKGIKRIRTYDELKAYGYEKQYIEYCIRKVYNMNIIKELGV